MTAFRFFSRSLTYLTLGLSLLAGSAQAQSTGADASDQVQQRFSSQFPGIRVDGVSSTPYGGLYEIRVGNTLLYADEAVNYVLEGNLIDGATRRNLTAQRQEQLNAIDFAELPLDLAFLQVRGDGSRKLAIFEDPNCGYCKQLRKTLLDLDDVSVYTFMYPILSPDSAAKVQSIWCAEDKGAVWDAWMIDGKTPATLECDAPMDDFVALGRKHNVRGTPTLFFADGSRATGALPLAMLQQRLQQAQAR
ncbi:MAG: DsbC family protein [Pigmentiphaga sp.]